ncbi:hypothetical protein [Amycolatopsis sp. H20-H5]|uniref:hypothetical protein n=1 Tax=Amycolatopsis sp. H20-H5 TaxID=3046309 RepID=UPI002DB693C6|nr:hypothetical protein [Amycolatopsis sp. H20-H5]MEC3978544.1 hypothetical protein [Amycolatopsis sp. H20-H5]
MGTSDSEESLYDRIHDLAATLPEDAHWLTGSVSRADGWRDLGERLDELGSALRAHADELDRVAAGLLPEHGWIPEAGRPAGRRRVAHYVGKGELRLGLIYVSACGTPCFPLYGRDRTGKTVRHERCRACEAARIRT